MAINWGGASLTLDVGVKNGTGAVRQEGDIVAIELNSTDADGFEAILPVVTAGHPAGVLAAVGCVITNRDVMVGEEMMVRVYGPAKARVDGSGVNVQAYDILQISNGSDQLISRAAEPNMTTGNETLVGLGDVARTKAVYVGAAAITAADQLVDVWMKGL